jgi:hypothetical protein
MDRSQYISRCVVFSKEGDKVSLVDLYNQDTEARVYEPWLGLVVALADGQHTIGELITYASQHYAKGPPSGLDVTIESAVMRLSETGTVRLSDEPIELPYYLTLPAERLDVPRALQLMAEDGYTREQADADLGGLTPTV